MMLMLTRLASRQGTQGIHDLQAFLQASDIASGKVAFLIFRHL